MSFTRRSLVLSLYPINYFVRGTGRTNILSKLYDFFAEKNADNYKEILDNFFKKVKLLDQARIYSINNDLKINRLALECFLWGLSILDLEEINYQSDEELISKISKFIDANILSYTFVDYNFSSEIMTRYLATANFLSKNFNISFNTYITAGESQRSLIKNLNKPVESSTRLAELESLRLSKPEPANNSIDDIIRVMSRRRYLIRPSYQRNEVINIDKASAIIESILLGIKLPPIFVYKRSDGTNEVIDGQQRLLTLIGFIGADFLNENNSLVKSKNHKFKLRKLRILKELNGLSFHDLPDESQNKIFDFQIYVVEIDAIQNPNFDPVDLFIRLNDKPYPIRENSFEMWNSWADIELIKEIRKLKESIDSWFYIKQIKRNSDRDRMENEEIITSLCYIEFYRDSTLIPKTIDIFQKGSRMNSRINTKALISTLMLNVTENNDNKTKFLKSIKDVKSNITKIKYVLIDKDIEIDKLSLFLRNELDFVFNGGSTEKRFRRRIQDFYFLWVLIEKLNLEMVKFHRISIKEDIISIFNFVKDIPLEYQEGNKGFQKYKDIVESFHNKYQKSDRIQRLNESQKLELIRSQNNLSSISNAPIFLGDDIEVDHIKPLSIGGNDSIDNFGIAHKDENRRKGSKY